MPKGAKKGASRFKEHQDKSVKFRINRIESIVIPKLKELSPSIKVPSINKFSKLVVSLFNNDLPLNEQPIGLRTITQNSDYWEILEIVYHQYFSSSKKKESFQKYAASNLQKHKIKSLEEKINRLKSENQALKSAFTNIPIQDSQLTPIEINQHLADKENLCRLIYKLIDIFDGTVIVNTKEQKISNLANSILEEDYGILPREVVSPLRVDIKHLRSRTSPVLCVLSNHPVQDDLVSHFSPRSKAAL